MSCSNASVNCKVIVYDECSKQNLGTLLLSFLDESEWNQGLRTFIYLIALLWCFMGVAIIADVFMCAIETITSKTKKVKVAKQGPKAESEWIEVRVWNDTVANLTLMALGSSAPEILLSIIEIVGNNFKAGELGPSTIVGSAAFNLLVITGICVMAIPAFESRRIKNIKVFAVTAITSLFAYIWLYIILSANTKDVVDLWEAILTFLMFPILVIIAYIMDKDFCCSEKVQPNRESGMLELGKYLNLIKDSFRAQISINHLEFHLILIHLVSNHLKPHWEQVRCLCNSFSVRIQVFFKH